MILDSVFGAAYIDNGKRHRILGVLLRPFCLWHLYLLQALDSPLIRKEQPNSLQLKTAISICRLKPFQSKLHRPKLPILTNRQLDKALSRFYGYVGDYLQKPEYSIVRLEDSSGKPPPKIPHMQPPPLAVVAAFEAAWGSGCTVEKAWGMPIGQAYIAQAMYLRHQGLLLDFMLDDERKFQQQLIEAGYQPG